MAVAALSTAGLSQYVALTSNVGASQQAWQSLQQSLSAGNLTAAQSAFNAYQKLSQNLSGSGSTSSASSQLSIDMTALGNAIGSGDLTTAQQAFATVQNDMKNTPSQSIANAESAVAQTVTWVDDLLNFGDSNSSPSAPVDPVTAIFESVYGLNSSTNTTDPTLALLESKYGPGASSGAVGSGAAGSSAPSAGNSGSAASVNLFA